METTIPPEDTAHRGSTPEATHIDNCTDTSEPQNE